ncbi:MAG TPA: TolC family protein [Candidatus Sulfotelmatobacter sp.]|jgi:cobalt-zinc-cadmium efflux system outer membrane protein|nr:TolC family protein [Candidatus Sulfotelmatobacter sp.]
MRSRLLIAVAVVLGNIILWCQTPPQPGGSPPQQVWTWDRVKEQFQRNNTTLLASKLNIDELKAQEITAHLRPNPDFTLTADGTQISPSHGVWQPFAGTFVSPGVSYLFERRNKRGLRYEAAKQGTAIGAAQSSDTERTLLFNLRTAFVGILQAKAVLRLAHDNLEYYDKILKVSRDRFQAGDIARIDLDRLELQRLQYESDLQNAEVNLRTTKINLLALLDDRRPVDSFDVEGTFDFRDDLLPLDDYRKEALDARPDLRAALLTVKQAETNYKLAEADGSTDPTIGLWFTHNGSFNNPDALNTIGASVSIPLRIFDRNQGEKLRTKIDISRNEKLRQGVETQVYSDVDSAYATLNSNINLLKPYKRQYLEQAVRVRDTVFFSYQHGGASLLDFLNAESEYRSVELNYVNLVGSYLTAAAQINQAVGREVIQ